MAKKPKRKSPTKTIRTLKGIAGLVSAEFKIPCDRQKINWWQSKVDPPFPMPGENNEFDIKKCFAWVKKFLARKGETKENPQLELYNQADAARANQRITAAERERFEFDKERGLFVERDIANQTIAETMREYHEMVKKNIRAIASEDVAKKLIVEIEADCKRIAVGEV